MFYRLKKELKLLAVFACLVFLFPASAMGAESAASGNSSSASGLVLSMDDAVKLAVANSNELKSSSYSLEQDEESRDKAQENLTFIPSDGSSSEAVSTYKSMVNSELDYQMSIKTDSVKKDTVVKDVFEKYTDVLNAQEKVKLAQKNLEYSRFQRLAAQVGYQAKTVSLNSKNTAERDYMAKESALIESQASLDTSYEKLNSLLGLTSKQRPVLQDDPQYSVLKIDNLETEIQRRLEVDPDIWLADQQVEKAQLNLNLYSWSASSSYRVQELDLLKTQLSAADTKEQARQSLRSTYNSIYQLEQQYNTRQQDLATAEDNLSIAQTKFNLGLVAKGDLLKAEMDLTSAQQSLKSLIYQHELLKISFDKPWA
ncbi:MAG: TolC family protein [Syntrophomonas sp.]